MYYVVASLFAMIFTGTAGLLCYAIIHLNYFNLADVDKTGFGIISGAVTLGGFSGL